MENSLEKERFSSKKKTKYIILKPNSLGLESGPGLELNNTKYHIPLLRSIF